MYIDTHAHLYAEEFDLDRDDTIHNAYTAGVKHIVLPDIDKNSRGAELELAEKYPDIMLPLLGIHPTSIDSLYREEIKELERALSQRRAYGIGECGIDLYWDKSYFKEQSAVFEYQLNLAHEIDIPIIIHSRESLQEIFTILKKQHFNVRGIFHCFSGSSDDARRAIDFGFYLGIGGVVTFKNSQMGQLLQSIEPEHIVLETDAPYLAPVPYRGKRNDSSYIPIIAKKVAEITGRDIMEIATITTNNAKQIFSKFKFN